MIRSNKSARFDRWDGIFFLLLLGTAAFFLWRCRYGFANIDEAFYPTVPHRLAQGDRLLMQEWHLTQLSSVLLYVPVVLYEKLTGGTDGIYLALRHLCVVTQCLAAAAVYLKTRKYHKPGAAAGALALAVYTPFNINALSYHSLGILFMAFTGILLAETEEKNRVVFALTGFLFACAVLCSPHLIALYGLYALAVLLFRKRRGDLAPLAPESFAFFTLGAAVCAVLFFFIGLYGADFSGLRKAIHGILTDPEHSEQTAVGLLIYSMAAYPARVIVRAGIRPGICMAAVLVLALIARIDKKRERHTAVYLLLGTVLTAAAQIFFYIEQRHPNFFMYAVNLLALLCVCASPRDRTARRLMLFWWLPGMAYSFLVVLGSNQGSFVIFSAAASAVPCSMILIFRTARSLFPQSTKSIRALTAAALAALTIVQIGAPAEKRCRYVFWGNEIVHQTVELTEGPEKGIIGEPYSTEAYNTVYPVVRELERRAGDGEVLVLSDKTYLFLGKFKNAGYSAWLSGVNDTTLERLALYYEINPDKLPVLAWTETENAAYAEKFADMFGYVCEQTDMGIFLTPKDESLP